MRGQSIVAGGVFGLLLCLGPAVGAENPSLIDSPIPAPNFTIGNSLIWAPLDIYGAGYVAHQPANAGGTDITAAALVQPQFEHPFENGWSLGIKTTFLLHHDELSGDNYGNDFVEKAYIYLQTQYGRIEVGQADGAAYSLEATGPLVAGPPAIDDGNVTFFVDPSTQQAFTNIFPVRTGVFATENDAKVSYYSPRVVDLQIGVSFTPSETKGFPFFSHAHTEPNQQRNVLEAGANYAKGLSRRTTIHAYAGFAHGNVDNRTPGNRDAFDWALGSEIDYDLNWALVAAGGAYRESRGYTFDIDQSYSHGKTRAAHASARLTRGPWQFGFEYSTGTAGAASSLPELKETGFEPSISCAVTANLQLVAGYQHLEFRRSEGEFYNNKQDVPLNAGFLYFEFKL